MLATLKLTPKGVYMKQAFTKRFLCLALLLPFQVMIAQTATPTCVQVQDKSHFVYLSTEMRRAVECLNRMLPNHKWSPEFKEVCDRIAKDGIAAPYAEAEAVVVECLNLLDGNNCAELQEAQDALKRYADALRKGDANLVLIDDNGMITRACGSCNTGCNTDCNTDCNSKCIKYKKTKAFCNLFAHDLQVDGSAYLRNLTTNSLRVTGNLVVDGEIINGEGTEVFDNLTVNGIFTANGTSNIGANAVDNSINVGTDALTGRSVIVGNAVGTSSLTLRSGTGDVTVTSTDAVTVDSVGVLELNSSAGAISIGNDANTGAINIGTGAAARTITVGNVTGATALNLTSGTGGLSAQSTGTINVGTNATAQAINIGTGAADKDIVIGSTTAGSTINLATPAGTGVTLRGLVGVFVGAGDPNTVVTAPQGSLYLNTTGSGVANRAWINTNGITAWTSITTAA